MGIGDAYPFGTMLCRTNYFGEHQPTVYLGCFPYSVIDAADGHVRYVEGGKDVDVICSMMERPWGAIGWDRRESIERAYHLWDPLYCPEPRPR